MKDAMRDFANTSIRFDKLMTDERKLCYGICTADRNHAPVGASAIRRFTTRFSGQCHEEKGEALRHSWHENTLGGAGVSAYPFTPKFDEGGRVCLCRKSAINLKDPAQGI
jgi:hypothetical protein